MQYNDILKELESLFNPQGIEGMKRVGITPRNTYGVSIVNLRKIAGEIGTDHGLAQQLWKADIRETRILASIIEDPQKVTEEQMDDWVKSFDYWEICDQCC